jgi:hypothetical protein
MGVESLMEAMAGVDENARAEKSARDGAREEEENAAVAAEARRDRTRGLLVTMLVREARAATLCPEGAVAAAVIYRRPTVAEQQRWPAAAGPRARESIVR